jgi:hypothetical protein
MSGNFSHQLARRAKVWSATTEDGVERRILVIVTTIELDPKHDRYSKERRLDGGAEGIRTSDLRTQRVNFGPAPSAGLMAGRVGSVVGQSCCQERP